MDERDYDSRLNKHLRNKRMTSDAWEKQLKSLDDDSERAGLVTAQMHQTTGSNLKGSDNDDNE